MLPSGFVGIKMLIKNINQRFRGIDIDQVSTAARVLPAWLVFVPMPAPSDN